MGSGRGVFKVTDPSGNTHRVKCTASMSLLLDAVASKANIPKRLLQLEYIDDEGDVVRMTSDDDVAEAWALAVKAGNNVAKLTAVLTNAQPVDPKILAGAGAAVAIIGIFMFVLLRPKKS